MSNTLLVGLLGLGLVLPLGICAIAHMVEEHDLNALWMVASFIAWVASIGLLFALAAEGDGRFQTAGGAYVWYWIGAVGVTIGSFIWLLSINHIGD